MEGMFKEENMVFKITEFWNFSKQLSACKKIIKLLIHDYMRRMDNSFEYRLDIVELIEHFYLIRAD